MSLLGATIGVDATLLTSLVGDATTLARYSKGDAARITKSCDIAADEFRSAALKGRFTAAAIDALTAGTIPVRWKEHVAYFALDDLSYGIGRPDDIGIRAELARKHFGWLAGGAETIDGLSNMSTTGGGGIRINAPESLVFDGGTSTTSTPLSLRDPSI